MSGGCTHYISEGRDVPAKGVLFSESVWNRGIMFHHLISVKGFQNSCLEREYVSSRQIWEGIHKISALKGRMGQ